MAQPFTFTTYIYRGSTEREFPVEVTYTVSPFVPARTYGPAENCYPAEGGEVEVLDAKLIGHSYPLTEDEWDRIQEDCENRAGDDLADAEADRGDYLFEQARDRAAESHVPAGAA